MHGHVRRASGTRWFLLERPADEALLARALMRFAFIDLESGQPCAAPPEMTADFAEHIAG